jgi:hypothetical protein
VVGIDDLIADFVQPLLLFQPEKKPLGAPADPAIVAEMRMDSQFLASFRFDRRKTGR